MDIEKLRRLEKAVDNAKTKHAVAVATLENLKTSWMEEYGVNSEEELKQLHQKTLEELEEKKEEFSVLLSRLEAIVVP